MVEWKITGRNFHFPSESFILSRIKLQARKSRWEKTISVKGWDKLYNSLSNDRYSPSFQKKKRILFDWIDRVFARNLSIANHRAIFKRVTSAPDFATIWPSIFLHCSFPLFQLPINDLTSGRRRLLSRGAFSNLLFNRFQDNYPPKWLQQAQHSHTIYPNWNGMNESNPCWQSCW